MIRAFVAVRVSGKVADALENFLSELRPLAKIRWVRREQFHITLKFLGELENNVIDDVIDALTPMKSFAPFTVELNHIGAFPNLNSPRVLWLGGDKGAAELGRLAKKVNDVLHDSAGLERESKKFTAHLTRARLKDTVLPEELVQRLGDAPELSWECSELVLMKSLLTPQGPIYSQLM